MDAASDAACGRACGLTRPVDVYVSFERENRGRGVSLFRGLLRRGRFAPLFAVTPPPFPLLELQELQQTAPAIPAVAGGSRCKIGLRTPKPAVRGTHTTETLSRTRWCCGCLEWHPLEAFRPSEAFVNGCGYCSEYRAAAVRRWRERNPEAVEDYNAQRRIGPRDRECVDCGASFTAGARGRVLRIVAPAAGVSSGERRNPSRRKRSPSPTLPPGRVGRHASNHP